MGRYAFALVSAKYLDENGNFNVPKGEVAEVINFGDGMDKSKFWMLDLLSYDAHFAVRSTRRKIYA